VRRALFRISSKGAALKRTAILSDIHGNIPALEAVVADIKNRQVDCTYNLGDHASGPLWPKETLQYLMRQDWIHLRGNHDRQLVEQDPKQHGLSDQYAFQFLEQAELAWLRALPAQIELPNGLLLFHGVPESDMIYLLETVEHGRARLATPLEIEKRLGGTKARVMLCGHTHISRVVEISKNILIVNPGSVGLPAFDHDVPEPHIMETGSPHARYAILEQCHDAWHVEIILVPYDYQSAVAQAMKNNRRDWAMGLQSGYMQDFGLQ